MTPSQASAQDELVSALEVGERFLKACYSAWLAGEPSHRVEALLDRAYEFHAALDRVAKHRGGGQ